jgi:hypothetical protein
MALRCLVWVNDFTTEAQRHREKYKITLNSIKIPLCLCVCGGERSLKFAEIFSGSSDSPTENSEEP